MLTICPSFTITSLLKEDKKALALLALKRRKQQGELIHQTEEHLLQVNGLISNVEMASMQAEVVKALAQGNTALKRMQSEVSADYVSQLMEENSELQYDVAEVGRMLSQTQSEDPDVFAEYERLEAMVALDIASAVPSVPAAALPEQTTVAKEEEEKQGEEAMVVS
jgi:F420-dependent methylenetetrahydromethanopterin dehydrogenase